MKYKQPYLPDTHLRVRTEQQAATARSISPTTLASTNSTNLTIPRHAPARTTPATTPPPPTRSTLLLTTIATIKLTVPHKKPDPKSSPDYPSTETHPNINPFSSSTDSSGRDTASPNATKTTTTSSSHHNHPTSTANTNKLAASRSPDPTSAPASQHEDRYSGGTGFGNRGAEYNHSGHEETRFGSAHKTDAYRGAAEYGSGATGGAGFGNKAMNLERSRSGKEGEEGAKAGGDGKEGVMDKLMHKVESVFDKSGSGVKG